MTMAIFPVMKIVQPDAGIHIIGGHEKMNAECELCLSPLFLEEYCGLS
jgi:hypothetical protein